ncbi:MAG: murein L,D-transpeptidase catalytic domain-containing protein [Ferruginibacter sp.]
MKIARRTFVLTAGLLLTVSTFGYFFWYKPKLKLHAKHNAFAFTKSKADDNAEAMLRLSKRSSPAKEYIAGHGFNSKYCFLVDMRIPSGKNRFFVYNLAKDSVEIAGLVAHGSGTVDNADTATFSNIPNSYCTSLGKYKIGNAYNGRFGLAYKLYGLDKTNSKAFDRFVVLHAHECVPNDEVSPSPICESWGCPTVAPAFLTRLKTYLDRSAEPILLWIYY